MFLMDPSTLIFQSLSEVKCHWPGLKLDLSHSDGGLVKSMRGMTLGPHEMRGKEAAGELSKLFEHDISNRNVIIALRLLR